MTPANCHCCGRYRCLRVGGGSLLRAGIVALLLVSAHSAAAQEYLYQSSNIWDVVVEIDSVTGDRRTMELADYPRILKVSHFAVEPTGSLLIETVDAVQRRGVYRLDPTSGAVEPLSGGVDGFSEDLLGDGPPFSGPFRQMVLDDSVLYALQAVGGIIAVDCATGNRWLVTPREQSNDKDAEPELTEPDDMVLLADGALLVADRFEGLIRVDVATGARERLPAEVAPLATPRRMDLLSVDTLVYAGLDPDVPALWVLNLATGRQQLLSGSFGGVDAGDGPPMAYISDLTVDSVGRLWVYDPVTPALFLISPEGDRLIVSSPEVGAGPPLFDAFSRPLMGTWFRAARRRESGNWSIY